MKNYLEELIEKLAQAGWTMTVNRDNAFTNVNIVKGEDVIAFACPGTAEDETIAQMAERALDACKVTVKDIRQDLAPEVDAIAEQVNETLEEIARDTAVEMTSYYDNGFNDYDDSISGPEPDYDWIWDKLITGHYVRMDEGEKTTYFRPATEDDYEVDELIIDGPVENEYYDDEEDIYDKVERLENILDRVCEYANNLGEDSYLHEILKDYH